MGWGGVGWGGSEMGSSLGSYAWSPPTHTLTGTEPQWALSKCDFPFDLCRTDSLPPPALFIFFCDPARTFGNVQCWSRFLRTSFAAIVKKQRGKGREELLLMTRGFPLDP